MRTRRRSFPSSALQESPDQGAPGGGMSAPLEPSRSLLPRIGPFPALRSALKRLLLSVVRSPTKSGRADPPADHPFQYSMVVDWSPVHAYQAEILLFTLEEFGRVPRDRIVIQCTDRVSEEVRGEFKRSGYRVSSFTSGPDGTYCSEIARLGDFLDHPDPSVNGIFLLDPDLVVLAPLEVPDPNVVWGKVVDEPSLSLPSMNRLFSAADLELPGVVPCDWQETGDTIATNMNVGFLYIPLPLASRLRSVWHGWAEFLSSRPDLFDDPSDRGHIDQLSFAMALTSERIAYSNLPANWNFPCHHEQLPHTFRSKEVLRVVRYDTRLDIFGLISPIYSDNAAFDAELERANAAIGRRPATSFFSMYKQHVARQVAALVPITPKKIFSQAFVARTRIGDRKRRLVLHGGAPKTGTSSLQDYLGANRSILAEEGWWYPPPDAVDSLKHQGLVLVLLRTDESAFVEYIESALRDMPDHAHTVMLTTEGIFNHWWDYTPEAKGLMRHLAALFDFELCVWFRQPEEFAASYYVQSLKNLRIAGLPCDSYGRDIDFTDAMRDEWFLRHLDYLGFCYEAEALFGYGCIKALPYTGDTVRAFLDRYRIDGMPANHPRKNESMRQPGVAMQRILNRFELEHQEKRHATELIRQIDAVIGERAGRFSLSETERDLVARYTQRGWDALWKAGGWAGLCKTADRPDPANPRALEAGAALLSGGRDR